MSVHNRPTARQSQPTAFLGRLEAIRAPTSGKAKKRAPPTRLPTPRSALQLLGRSAPRARNHSGMVAKNRTKVSPASDHANQVEARVFALAPSPFRLLVPSATIRTLQHHRFPSVTTTVTRWRGQRTSEDLLNLLAQGHLVHLARTSAVRACQRARYTGAALTSG